MGLIARELKDIVFYMQILVSSQEIRVIIGESKIWNIDGGEWDAFKRIDILKVAIHSLHKLDLETIILVRWTRKRQIMKKHTLQLLD